MPKMLTISIIGILVFIVITLNLLVLKKSTISKHTKVAYTVISVTLLLWQITLIYSTFVQDYPFFHRITFFFALWLVQGWQMISLFYPKRIASKGELVKLKIGLILSSLISILLLGTKAIITGYDMDTGVVGFTIAQYPFFIYVISEVIYLITKFYSRFKAEKESRLYLKYIFFAIALYGGLGIIFNLILPLMGYQSYSIIGSLVGLVPTIAVFYTIYAKRVFSTKFIIGKFYYFLTLSTLSSLMLFVFFKFFSSWKSETTILELVLIIITSGIIFIITIENIRIILEKSLKKFFFEEKYRYENIQQDLLDSTKGNLKFNDIYQSFKIFLSEKIGISVSNLIIIDKGTIIFGNNYEDNHLIKKNYTSISNDSHNNIHIFVDNIHQDFLQYTEYRTIITTKENNQISTIILLGEKDSKEPLTSEDFILLETFARIINLTISRAKLFQEVDTLNTSLQQKVDLQTKELQQKVKELEEARRKEADMIDIMGHELRTPMSVVKLNTDLLHNFSSNVTLKKDDFLKYVGRIKDAVETEIKLINTLLSSAKLEGDKIVIHPEKVNLIEQIKMSLHAHEAEAERKGLQIQTSLDPNSPEVFADHARVVEIVNNLIDNAIKYTNQGTITVITKDEGEFVRTSIIDTGPGMKREDIERLGTKFFRTEQYIDDGNGKNDISIVRPGGTGLGLYVTFNLVRKMGGGIHVESEVGKGSNFTFTLPKFVGQVEENMSETNDMFEKLGLKKQAEFKDKIQE